MDSNKVVVGGLNGSKLFRREGAEWVLDEKRAEEWEQKNLILEEK